MTSSFHFVLHSSNGEGPILGVSAIALLKSDNESYKRLSAFV